MILRKLATPFLAGMGVAAATLASGFGLVMAFAAAAGLLGLASHRAATRLTAEEADRDRARRHAAPDSAPRHRRPNVREVSKLYEFF